MKNATSQPGMRVSGEPFIWLTGGALALCLIMVFALVGLIAWNGMGSFWPKQLKEYVLKDGRKILGRLEEREKVPGSDKGGAEPKYRIKVKQANRSLSSAADFLWFDEADIVKSEVPQDATVLERREWGDFYGYPLRLQEGGAVLAEGPEATWKLLLERLPGVHGTFEKIHEVEKYKIGEINAAQNEIRLSLRRLDKEGVTTGPEVERLNASLSKLQERYKAEETALIDLRSSMKSVLVMRESNGKETSLALSMLVRPFQPNRMGFFDKIGHYFAKLWEFIFDDPRESNTEGGVFPALFGTVLMVVMMSVVVTPLGVIAAFFLREYAKQGTLVSIVRIAVNNLAGVPSIVFGVFGLGFFIYLCGGSIDRLFFSDSLPTPTFGTGGILWASLTLALLTVPVVIVATEEGLAAIPNGLREASLALGATKFETTVRVVLPAVMPSVLTGLILAMARASGEVAPLMITGVVKLAPTLALDSTLPFLHLDRKFMHLGFHIYDVGFQSPNVDAARPMVFTTTLLLLFIVVALNLFAISVRNRLRKKFATSAV